MIIYSNSGVFASKILFRLHGSAVFKSCTPALLSSIIYIALFQYTKINELDLLDHPYPIGSLVTAFSFLLIFRANFSYNRYWEAQTAIHTMHSKFLDVATELAAFHLQSACYESIQPPSFGKNSLSRFSSSPGKRLQHDPITQEQLEQQIDTAIDQDIQIQQSLRSRFERSSNDPISRRWFGRSQPNLEQKDVPPRKNRTPAPGKTVHFASTTFQHPRHASDFLHLQDGTPYTIFWKHAQARLREGHITEDVPIPYFLETAAHLLSLLSAVAFSTLRNDLEEAESPLAEFRPGAPWPHVDPDAYQGKIRKGWYRSEHRIYTILRYLCGLTRTDKARMLYNKGRPFRVIGSVSDGEIQALQAARGPQAKVTLVSFWLQELITREHMAGSTGAVAPPIISRFYQFISDGMSGYNQARKIAYIPFPFPHAQITTLFVLVIVGCIPVLMLTYLESAAFGFFWNWLTVMCFTGLHEVARELENPFQNIPNEIPLNHFQAQFNEGLMIMFFGFHPDSYWLLGEENAEDWKTETTKMDNDTSVSSSESSGMKVTSTSSSTTMERNETPLQMSSLDDTLLIATSAMSLTTEIGMEEERTTTKNRVAWQDNNDFSKFNFVDDDDGSNGSVIYAPTLCGYEAS